MTYSDITKLRNGLETHIGRRVRLVTKKGRNRTITDIGVIESIYPSVFTVMLDKSEEQDKSTRATYSYTDILTNNIELTLFKAREAI